MNDAARAKTLVGTIAVASAAIVFGLAPPLARLAYDAGANPATLVELRFLVAAIILVVLMTRRLRLDSTPIGRAPILVLGVIGIATAVASSGYMAAVELIPAGMACLLFYTFPIQVTLLAAALGEERLTLARLLAGAVCLLGVALAVGVAPVLPDFGGVALALFGAAGVATLIVLSARTMQRMNQLAVQTTSTVIATICFTIWMISTGGPAWPTGLVGWACLLGASLSSAVANIVFLFGVGRVGPGRAALLANLEPVTVLALAPLLLDEHLTSAQMAGAGLVLAAITILPIVEARKSIPKHSI